MQRDTPTSTATGDDIERVRLELGTHYGSALTDVRIDWRTGRVRYQLTAPHVSGCVTVAPQRSPVEFVAVPTAITVYYGDPAETGVPPWQPHPQALMVNGIELVGHTGAITAEHVENGRLPVVGSRRVNTYGTERVPDRTNTRLRAVLHAVLTHYLANPHLPQLQRAAARFHAPTRRGELAMQVHSLTKRITALTRERDTHRAQIRALDELLAETSTAPTQDTGESVDLPGIHD